jgi:hypothetical protein
LLADVSLTLEREALMQLSKARSLEGRLCTSEFSFTSAQLERVRDFATRAMGDDEPEAPLREL